MTTLTEAYNGTTEPIVDALPARTPEPNALSPNELPVVLDGRSLEPHLRIIKPSRPALTYERME